MRKTKKRNTKKNNKRRIKRNNKRRSKRNNKRRTRKYNQKGGDGGFFGFAVVFLALLLRSGILGAPPMPYKFDLTLPVKKLLKKFSNWNTRRKKKKADKKAEKVLITNINELIDKINSTCEKKLIDDNVLIKLYAKSLVSNATKAATSTKEEQTNDILKELEYLLFIINEQMENNNICNNIIYTFNSIKNKNEKQLKKYIQNIDEKINSEIINRENINKHIKSKKYSEIKLSDLNNYLYYIFYKVKHKTYRNTSVNNDDDLKMEIRERYKNEMMNDTTLKYMFKLDKIESEEDLSNLIFFKIYHGDNETVKTLLLNFMYNLNEEPINNNETYNDDDDDEDDVRFIYNLISHYFLIGAEGESKESKERKERKEKIMILDILRYILNSDDVINKYNANKNNYDELSDFKK